MIQAPWVGNPDYGRNYEREQELHEEEIRGLERQIESNEEDIFDLEEELKELDKDSEKHLEILDEIDFLKYLNNKAQSEIEELEEL